MHLSKLMLTCSNIQSSLRKFYGRHHDLVDRYGIFESKMTMDNGVRVTGSSVLCVCFVDRCLSFCTFSFVHCVVCSSSMYRFWLPLWYLQTLLPLVEEQQWLTKHYTEEYRLYNMNPTLSEDEIMYSTIVGSSFSTSGSSCMFHTYLYSWMEQNYIFGQMLFLKCRFS
jgi:hypothetical protein